MAMASCNHPIHVGGMCAVCGTLLSDAQQSQSISMMHDTESVTVSRQEALRLDSESTRHLLEQRKLALIVDLDQTIIHATVDPTVGEWLKSPENPNYEALKGVGAFRLGMDGKAVLEDGTGVTSQASSSSSSTQNPDDEGCWYYVKPRPGLSDFLKSLAQRYELHVYTMGTRSYADCVCKLVDPDGSLFGTRILSRDENGSLIQKSLSRLFPMDTSMVVIIDDRGDVWGWSPNLVKVIPYDFFIGSGDINATFLPAAPGPAATGSSPSDNSSSSTIASSSLSTSSSTTSPSPPPSLTETSPPVITEQLDNAAEKEEAAADTAAKAKAEESQKSAVTEQLGSRPLAKMQEKLDEELGVTPSPSEIATEDAPRTDNGAEPPFSIGTDATSTDLEVSSSPSSTLVATAEPVLDAPGPPPLKPPQTAPPRPHAILKDDDTELQRVQKILDLIHKRWYEQWDAREESLSAKGVVGEATDIDNVTTRDKPTVMDIIANLKKEVLRDCDIVFSSLIPLGGSIEDSDYFWLACEYGASCSEKLNPGTTHLIAAKGGTAKVNAAQARGRVEVVWPNWLHETVARWERQPEKWYRLPRAPPDADPLSSEQPTDDELLTSSDEEVDLNGTEIDGPPKAESSIGRDEERDRDWIGPADSLAGVNWAEADKELEEFLNGSDGDDEDVGSDDEDASVAGYTTDGSRSQTLSRRGKRSRLPSPAVGSTKLNGTATPLKSSSLNQSISTSTLNGKRRRLSNDDQSETDDTDGERQRIRLSDPTSSSRPGTGGLGSSRNGTPIGGGDDMNNSFMRDLEDEIEAAMGAVSDLDDEDETGSDRKGEVQADKEGGGEVQVVGSEDDEAVENEEKEQGFDATGIKVD